MDSKLYSVGKVIACAIGGLLAAEAVSICGQALASDVGRLTDMVKGTIAKPEPVKPGIFGMKKRR